MDRKKEGSRRDACELCLESPDPYAESLMLSPSVVSFGLVVGPLWRENASEASLVCVCHRGGRGLCAAEGVDAAGVVAVRGKCVLVRLKSVLPRFMSICLRKASKSGFASMGSGLGIAAANDLTDDDGLQFSRGRRDESRGSPFGSTVRPK